MSLKAIPCIAWIKKGVLNGRPQSIKLTPEELNELLAKEDEDAIDDVNSDEEPENSDSSITMSDLDDDVEDPVDDELTRKYGLNKYDVDQSSIKASMKDIVYQRGKNTVDDGYILAADDEESDEEAQIHEDDNVIAIGRVQGEYNVLECYVYNEGTSSLYCHHDETLRAPPLVMEWIGYDPGCAKTAALIAVGGMDPDIEIWDMNVVNTPEPAFVLKGAARKNGSKKMKTSSNGHTDSILSLSWNKHQENVLASGSADFTIGLWDIEDGKVVVSIRSHKEKVQALQWHPFEYQTLLSGSVDGTVRVFDCRDTNPAEKLWDLPGEVERAIWNVHNPFQFIASTDNGQICCYDIRNEKAVFEFTAHKSPILGLAQSFELPGCLLTASEDKLVKVWDIRSDLPKFVYGKNFKLGSVYCISPNPDSGFVYAVGGHTEMRIFHLKTSEEILRHWDLPELKTFEHSKKRNFDDDDDDDDDEDGWSTTDSDVDDDNDIFDGDSSDAEKSGEKPQRNKKSNKTGRKSALKMKKSDEKLNKEEAELPSRKITNASGDAINIVTDTVENKKRKKNKKKKKKTKVNSSEITKINTTSGVSPTSAKQKCESSSVEKNTTGKKNTKSENKEKHLPENSSQSDNCSELDLSIKKSKKKIKHEVESVPEESSIQKSKKKIKHVVESVPEKLELSVKKSKQKMRHEVESVPEELDLSVKKSKKKKKHKVESVPEELSYSLQK